MMMMIQHRHHRDCFCCNSIKKRLDISRKVTINLPFGDAKWFIAKTIFAFRFFSAEVPVIRGVFALCVGLGSSFSAVSGKSGHFETLLVQVLL
jgi:hypothetical protein